MLPVSTATVALCVIAFTPAFLCVHAALTDRSSTSGCGLSLQTGQSTDITIKSGGQDRQFRVHVPTAYDKTIPTPLLFSFHGATKTMTDQETITRFSNSSVNPSMIAVYPQGLGDTWEGAPYHSSSLPSDKVFVTDTITYLKSHYCIDPTRIYASGMSNGGGFVNTLACSPTHGTAFAAFAPVSGAFYDDDVDTGSTKCKPAFTPLPLLEFHGQADKQIPYFGGESDHGPVPNVPNWLAAWARRNGCLDPVSNAEHEKVFQGYKHESYSCGGVQDIVQHYNITGLGHKWPTLSNSPVDASSRIIEFFHGRHK
ncbi:MAG: hypothetical protein Q9218_005773 [Villophora microphyllina]